jgi:hypothetical protein
MDKLMKLFDNIDSSIGIGGMSHVWLLESNLSESPVQIVSCHL